MEIQAFPADAVMLATGGPGIVFGKSTNSSVNTGAARRRRVPAGRVLRQRRVHPGAPHGHSRRGQAAPDHRIGARRGRPRCGPTATASRGTSSRRCIRPTATWCPATSPPARSSRSCSSMGLGIDGQPMVYLDLTHIDAKTLDRKLGGILEIYEKFMGADPRKVPMKIFPGMHYSMGGLWVDFDHMTNIPGPASPPARWTTSTTAPTGWAPTRCSPASTAARSPGPNMVRYARAQTNADARRRPWRRNRSGRKRPTPRLRKMDGKENVFALRQGAGRVDDRQRHGDPRQRQAARHRRQDPRAAGALGQRRSARPRRLGQPGAVVHQAVPQHAGARPRDHARGACAATRAAAPTTSPSSPNATTPTS